MDDQDSYAKERPNIDLDETQIALAAAAGLNVQRLTNKKKEYLLTSIKDKNGDYSYLDNP